jgi:antitoxin component of MazEF toxin-antitoxin module
MQLGYSLGLRLPKEIAAAAGLVAGTLVRVRLMDDGSVTVTPIAGEVAFSGADAEVKPLKSAAKW